MQNAKVHKQHTLLGYNLTPKQNLIVNYLIPSFGSCILYIALISIDFGVVYRHYSDDNPIWSSLTLFLMYLPALGSYYVTLTTLELWPEQEGFGLDNMLWAVVKTLEHFLFPVWSMWRYAERMFWSIEGSRAENDAERNEAVSHLDAPRTIELYAFLQSYLHSLPQVLLQLFILMRHKQDINRETVGAEVVSILLNLSKTAVTTAFFQRFKTQKIAGKQYPWFKAYKNPKSTTASEKNMNTDVSVPDTSFSEDTSAERTLIRPDESDVVLRQKQIRADDNETPNRNTLRRSSSDFYLQPSTSFQGDKQGFVEKHIIAPVKHFHKTYVQREVSVLDIPKRTVFHEPDFNIRRLKPIKGMPEDDFAGKLVSFIWWFCFLLVRVLAISAFFFFYPKGCIYLLSFHVILIIAILLYDVKTGDVERDKVVFFLFLGYVYLFCVIEFKIKFKKATLIYSGFFILTYLENFVMCLVWWFSDIEKLENDFWFRFVFLTVVMGSLFSVTAMCLYLNVNKPKKVVVGTVAVEP